MTAIFLSASIPLPDRHPRFLETADNIAIRYAVKSLVEVILPIGTITFGGHPAITPLIAMVMQTMSGHYRDRVHLFQSEFFQDRFISEIYSFPQLTITPARGSLAASVETMRQEMLSSAAFDAGIFIGGMEGVLEEYVLFRHRHPAARRFPIASTGAAALEIFREHSEFKDSGELLAELTYPSLFRSMFRSKNGEPRGR